MFFVHLKFKHEIIFCPTVPIICGFCSKPSERGVGGDTNGDLAFGLSQNRRRDGHESECGELHHIETMRGSRNATAGDAAAVMPF